MCLELILLYSYFSHLKILLVDLSHVIYPVMSFLSFKYEFEEYLLHKHKISVFILITLSLFHIFAVIQ